MAQRLIIDGRRISARHAGVRVYLVNILRILAYEMPDSLIRKDIHLLLQKGLWEALSPDLQEELRELSNLKINTEAATGVVSTLLRTPPGWERGARYFSVDYYGWLMGPVTSTACIVHDLQFKNRPETFSASARLFRRIIFWAHNLRRSRLMTISTQTSQELERYFPRLPPAVTVGSGTTINWVNPERIKGFTEGEFYLTVGTLHAHKNHVALISAFSQVAPNKLLILAGKAGNAKAEVLAAIELAKEGNGAKIEWLDGVSDAQLAWLYQQATGVFLPTLYEGYGLPAAEAIVMEKALACSNLTVLEEISGDAAHYFDPNNAGQIADTVTKMTTKADFRHQLQYKAFKRKSLAGFLHAVKKM